MFEHMAGEKLAQPFSDDFFEQESDSRTSRGSQYEPVNLW